MDTVAALFQHWFRRGDAPLRIEARSRGRTLERFGAPRAAVFFSGGLDALAACRANRLRFPLTHPAAIRDGIIVFGLEAEDPAASPPAGGAMKIVNLNAETGGASVRLSARVIWEDRPAPPADIFFALPHDAGTPLEADANPFLTAAIIPANDAGERRIAVEGHVCPRLVSGLHTVLALFQHWFGGRTVPITIEARTTAGRPGPRPVRAGAFLTGGIDSLATLRRNRLSFPPGHAEYIRDAVLLYGINFDSDDDPGVFAEAVRELSAVAQDAGATLLPITTNARRVLNRDTDFFRLKYHAAMLCAAAHALAPRLNSMSIASSHDLRNLIPWGSHPLLETNLSSADMRIYHDSLEQSRIDKTRLVAEWDLGLQNIKVCVAGWPGRNCGVCEKCRRTMLALIAVGALERCQSFPARDLDEETVRSIQIVANNQSGFYAEMIEPLRQAGRSDLARGVEFALKRFRGELGLRGRLKGADRVFLNGALTSMKRGLAGQPS